MRHPGDPTPRSPASVLSDRAYKKIIATQMANDMVRLVVFHRGTETFWQTYYKLYDDTGPAEWFKVVPKPKMVVDYELDHG